MTPAITVHGLAIVSADDRITDATGTTPDALMNDADWAYFQDWLDRADFTVLGRIGHEHNPITRNRKRLILSSSAYGLERRKDGWWWNPAQLSFDEAAAALLPKGGSIAVPGGQRVFDLFLPRYDVFHLSRAEDVVLGGGIGLFSGIAAGGSVSAILEGAGLVPDPPETLDPDANVTLTLYRRV